MRTTVNLPEPLIETGKRIADERGTTLSGILEEALRIYLARRQNAEVPPFQLHTVSGRLVNPNLDLDRTSALEIAEDEARFLSADTGR